jgi:asparagine synthase (glutamine-hydrolysing)
MTYDFLNKSYRFIFESNVKLYIKGRVWHNGAFLDDDSLLSLLRQHDNNLREIVDQFRGFFSVLFLNVDNLIIITDIVRSFPIFYRVQGNFILIAEDIADLINKDNVDKSAVVEYRLTGYVTGYRTLITDCFQTQGAEIVSFLNSDGTVTVDRIQYYEFDYKSCLENALFDNFDNALLLAFKRLIHFANGRQLVVPLSGGYDSRLIVMMLKRLGYSNVFTFSYGTDYDKEALVSKRVAEDLNFNWEFILYSENKWIDVVDLRTKYELWSSHYSTQPHVQDFLAVKELRDRKLVEVDAIFVPGHSGDFIAGSHLSNGILNSHIYNEEVCARFIFERHFNLDKDLSDVYRSEILSKIKGSFGHRCVSDRKSCASYFESWDWRERQCKFIVNSIRVYNFFNFDLWLPLWDIDVLNCALSSTLDERLNRKWYIDYLTNDLAKITLFKDVESLSIRNPSELSIGFYAVRNLFIKLNILYVFRKLKFLYFFVFNREKLFSVSYFVLSFNKKKFVVLNYLMGFESTAIYNRYILKFILKLSKSITDVK